MQTPFFLLKGLVIGFSIAAPVGPIGVLCIRRSLAKGRLSGFATGLGAATADAFYGLIAGFGLTFISSLLLDKQLAFKIVGIAFLFFLGVKTFLEKPKDREIGEITGKTVIYDYLSTLFLTITNPVTILSFAAVFAGLGLAQEKGNYLSAALLVLGVFLGSLLWWLFLSSFVGLFRKKLKEGFLLWINRISGIILTGFAAGLVISLF